MNKVIISRHYAAIKFIRQELPEFADAPVLTQATPADVKGKDVAGNAPLSIAAAARTFFAVEFDGEPPRGREYTAEDMRAAGARISAYRVQRTPVDPFEGV